MTNKPLGKLRYKTRYEPKTQKLHATVVECKSLKKTDLIGKSDPYVRVYLMPGTHMELKTKIVKNNLNPVYNDEFSFVLSPNDVRKKTIVFQVFDKDTFGKDDGIGEIQIPLWTVDLDIETDATMELSPVTKGKDNKPILIARRPPGDAGSISSRSSVTSLIGQGGANAGGWREERHSYSSHQAGNTAYQQSSYTQEQSYQQTSSSTRHSSHRSRKTSSSSSSGDEARLRQQTYTPAPPASSGGMSLYELNNRLEKYIRQIQLNPDGPNHRITVDRISEGGSFDIQNMPKYHDYLRLLDEYTKQEEELASVEGEIQILTHENEDYKRRVDQVMEKIEQKKIEISQLEIEYKRFQSERNSAHSTLIDTKQHNARVSVKQEQARFIDSLATLHFETVTITEEMVDEEEIRNKIKREYIERLKEETEKIGLLYGSYEGEMRDSIKRIFDAKISELKKLRAHWSDEEVARVDDILARLEHAKRTIIELEKTKLDLTQDERRLKEHYEEEELRFKTMLEAKRKEAEYLKEEYTKIQIEYKRFETDRSGYFREVERYGAILKDVHPTNVSVHAEQFYDRSLEPAPVDTSSSDSSGDDNDEYQRKKKAAYHQGDHRTFSTGHTTTTHTTHHY